MDDKTYNRITSIILLIIGVLGVFVSLMFAIPQHGFLGTVALLVSICILILGLDKDT